MEVSDLPALNAFLNGTAATFLGIGYILIRNGRETAHKRCMLAALATSTLFLVSYVVYHASAESSFGIQGGYQTDWTNSNAIKIETHTAGTLVVDLVDAAENRVVWRGIATGSVSTDPSKNRKIIQEAMRKMFDNFPPPPPRNP